MKNFDEERETLSEEERTFTIAREEFVMREVVPWQAIAEWEDLPLKISSKEQHEALIRVIGRFLDPADKALERWAALANDPDAPVSSQDMWRIFRWLLEATAGFPTKQPDGSGTSDASNGTTSKEASPAPVSMLGG